MRVKFSRYIEPRNASIRPHLHLPLLEDEEVPGAGQKELQHHSSSQVNINNEYIQH